ncbi:putative transposon, En/Spm-like protein [Tanacetum coccineum]
MVNATKESFDEDDLAKFQELLLDAEKPLYKGCPDFTKLFAIVKLLNLKGKYGASDKFFTELLGLLKKMLPAGNEMDDKEMTVCPTCGISRWKVDNKTHKVYENIPAKVMWYFPIIPRLQRLFKLESISEDLRWHATRRITDGVLRHPADSQEWCTIDEKLPEIAKDPRNLRLGISADGVDVNSGTD